MENTMNMFDPFGAAIDGFVIDNEDVDPALANFLVGLGIINKARKGEFSKVVKGFRAVSKKEAEDIKKHGFRPDPEGRSMQDKWFSESMEGAKQNREKYPDLSEIVPADVPKDVYDRSYKHPNIDNTGPGFCVSCSDLSKLKVGE